MVNPASVELRINQRSLCRKFAHDCKRTLRVCVRSEINSRIERRYRSTCKQELLVTVHCEENHIIPKIFAKYLLQMCHIIVVTNKEAAVLILDLY